VEGHVKVSHIAKILVPHMKGHVKSHTLPRYTWVMCFISLEETSSLKVPFVEEKGSIDSITRQGTPDLPWLRVHLQQC
jgi:hypothetical protein